MKIRFLRVEIEPWMDSDSGLSRLSAKVIAGNNIFETMEIFQKSDFESAFDYMMDNAKRKIKEAVKKQEQNEIVHAS